MVLLQDISFNYSDDKFGWDDREPEGTMDEPGWLGMPEWEQLPLPPLYIKVEYDDQDKTD